MKPEDFEKQVLNFLQECMDEVQEATQQSALQGLVDDIAAETDFEHTAEKLFEQQGVMDDDGKPVKVTNPAQALSRVDPEDGAGIMLTSEEDRWLRANKLYGADLLRQLGFKYNNS
ncbi:MAG: hypothetical protein ACXABY_27355 [Candidatus Thorarchaeota archaeon]|jgi:hypothetical protein